MWERYNMTSNCEPQCKKYFVGDFFVSRIHCTKIVLIFITTLLFDIFAISALPFYGAYTQSSCQKLALDNIIERFYDFDQIELAIAVLLTFSHEDLFPGRCKIIEFFYDD